MVRRADGPRPSTLALAFLLLAGLVGWQLWFRGGETVHEFVGATMGTSFIVKVEADLSPEERERVRGLIEERLERVERLMSTYDTASELSRFNRHASLDPVRVSEELLEVVALARDIAERSDGAFDVTVAPLVEAWGFGPGGDVLGGVGARPSEEEIERLRGSVGYRAISTDRAAGTLAKSRPEATVDLSAIAKGYAVEAVSAALVESGLGSALVEVGGELKAIGSPRSGRRWRVGIERPDDVAPGIWGTIELENEAIATSGDYRNYYEEGGVRYAHIIDPRTGRPIPMLGASVSVVHENAAAADAWATALSVLGPEEGSELARRQGLAAVFVYRAAEGLASVVTPALGDRFALEEVVR